MIYAGVSEIISCLHVIDLTKCTNHAFHWSVYLNYKWKMQNRFWIVFIFWTHRLNGFLVFKIIRSLLLFALFEEDVKFSVIFEHMLTDHLHGKKV